MYDEMFVAKRVQLARDVKSYRDVDLANNFNVLEDTVHKWFNRGFPKRRMPSLALFFEVEEWVFTDETLDRDDFCRIIWNPKLMDGYRPKRRPKIRSGSLKLIKEIKKPDGCKMYRSDLFHISSETVLLKMCVWGTKQNEAAQFEFVNKEKADKINRDRMSYKYHKFPHFMVFADGDNLGEKTIKEEIINHVTKGTHYISAHSKFAFELFVFEIYQ